MQEERILAYSSAEMQRISHSTGLPSSPTKRGEGAKLAFLISATLGRINADRLLLMVFFLLVVMPPYHI